MTSKVGPKGQVVIPKEFRDLLGIEPGDEVDFVLEDDELRVVPVGDWRELEGQLAGTHILEMLEDEHRSEIARDKRRGL